MASPSSQTIMVTGANGFVAGHIISDLLKAGYNVRGTIRSPSAVPALESTHSKYGSQFSTAIVPDMTIPANYKDALAGVTGIFHTASPLAFAPKDISAELLDPAINGVTSILKAAAEYGTSVKRVVITSSAAALLDMAQGYRPGYIYTEADWNPMTYAGAAAADGVTAYCASKALAEAAGWEWMKKNTPNFTLSTICPPWVFGPHIAAIKDLKKLNESTQVMYSLLGADVVPPIDFAGFIDVRDLAKAHVAALERDEAQGERFVVASHFDYQTAVDELIGIMPELEARLPKGVKGAGLKQEVYVLEGSRGSKVLGLGGYTPLATTMKDTFVQLLEAEKSG